MDKELRALGLEDKEVKIYLACLAHDTPTPTQVAKLTGLKRATVYFYLERLREKGLIEWEVHKARKHISPIPPRKGLKRYIAKKQEEVNRSEDIVKQLLTHVEKVAHEKTPGSKVYHYEGEEGIRFAIEKLLTSRKVIYWIGSMELFITAVGGEEEWYKMFTVRRLELGTVTRGITDRRILKYPRFSEMKEGKRSFRFLKEDFDIPALLGTFGDCICFFSLQKKEARVVLIENALMAQMFKFFFESLWDSLPEE